MGAGMNFTIPLALAVIEGRKTETRRQMSEKPLSPWYEGGCRLKVGELYAVCPGRGKHAVAKVKVLRVKEELLGGVTDLDARAEGFDSRRLFIAAWSAINRGVDESQHVWVVQFELAHLIPERASAFMRDPFGYGVKR